MGDKEAPENNLYRIAVLIDDLKHEDIQTRINSVRSLKEIAGALGDVRTREELIPFLDDTSIDDEDEVLLVLAEELGGLTEYIGGKTHIPTLLKPLEQLATVEEPTVRDKAIESLYTLASNMTNEHVVEHFVPLVRRLAEKDWFTSRMSACAIFAAAYPRVTGEIKAEIRGLFGKLSKDDVVTVRKSAATSLGKFAQVVEPELVRAELLPILEALTKDEQDTVRSEVVSNVIIFTNLANTPDRKHEMLKHIQKLAKDQAWRVRWTVAQSYLDIAESMKPTVDNEDSPKFVKLFVKLLRDEEAEVRTAATLKLTAVARVFRPLFDLLAQEFIPAVKELSEDACDFVRSAVASVIFGLAPVLGRDKTVENLVPFFLALLRDPEPEVRLNLISKLDDLEDVIPVEQLAEALLPSVSDLAKDGQWRTRHSIIQHVPLLAKHLTVGTFDDNLVELCMGWLQDEVFSIRQAATDNLKKLAEIYGEDWAKRHIIPKVVELNSNSSYLFRMQALRAVENLAGTISSELLNADLIPLVVRMAEDPTPNIKFNVAKCFERIMDTLDTEIVENDVRPCLRNLANDQDNDVKYFAEKTLQRFEGNEH